VAASGILPRVQRIANRADKIALGVVFFGGVAGIIFMKEKGLQREWIPLLPGALMILYFAFVHLSRRFRLREDVTGDNLYYLGFLFTLTSLAYALYVFMLPGRDPEDIVADFGVALVTTILGIFLRQVAVQLREDPVEIEREARLELADAATRLRGVLGTVVLDMNHFRRQIAQSIEEGMAAVAESASNSVTGTAERFREVTDALLKHIETVDEARAQSSRRINELAGNTVAAFEPLLDRIKRLEPPSDLIERKLAPAIQKIEQAAEAAQMRASAGADELKILSDLVTKAVRATADLDGRVQTLLNVCSLIDQLGQRLEGHHGVVGAREPGDRIEQDHNVALVLDQALGLLDHHLGDLDVARRRLVKGGRHHLALHRALHVGHFLGPLVDQHLARRRQAAEARAVEAAASFARAIGAQEQVLRGFRDEFQSQPGQALAVLTDAVRVHTRALQELSESAAAAVSAVRTHNAELDSELERSRRVTLEVQNELVSLAETVTRRLA